MLSNCLAQVEGDENKTETSGAIETDTFYIHSQMSDLLNKTVKYLPIIK